MSVLVPGFEPITLAELTERAGLLQRVDRKYVVPTDGLAAVLGLLPDTTRVLEVDDTRTHRYRSVYFDTDDLLSYRLTALSRRRRFKIRTRTYLDSGLRLLEVKTRGPRGTTVKQRVPYDGDGDTLAGADREAALSVLARAGAVLPSDPRLRPTLHSRYERVTLLLPESDSRVTVDTSLSWTLAADGRRCSIGPYAIVETKTSGRPAAMDRILWRHRHRPCSFSKFGTGLAALEPELPAHRWRPVLTHHMPPEESPS